MLTDSLIDILYTILVYLANSISVIGIIWIYQKIRNMKINLTKFLTAFIFCIAAYVICFEVLLGPINHWILCVYDNDILSWTYVNVTNYIVLVFAIYLFLERNIKINMILTSALWAMYTFLLFGLNNFLYLISSTNSIFYPILSIFLTIIVVLLQYILSKKLHLDEIIIEFEKNISYWFIASISILIIMAFAWTQIIIPKDNVGFRIDEVLIIFLVSVFTIALVQYADNLLKTKQENEYNQILLHQPLLF